ncbi:hypothetical protein O0L34_g11336 [Tuta absoluta]|nr:hypothetical protein O0L34_g11336 [Tuta absoluta]
MYCRLFFLTLYVVHISEALLCYNGTFSHTDYGEDPVTYRGLFYPSSQAIARIHCALTVACEENAMCFVRSWQARAKYAWIVQRGCYRPVANDSARQAVNVPTRAMSCTHRKLRDADYSVCLCHADWCNFSSPPVHSQYFVVFVSLINFLCLLF